MNNYVELRLICNAAQRQLPVYLREQYGWDIEVLASGITQEIGSGPRAKGLGGGYLNLKIQGFLPEKDFLTDFGTLYPDLRFSYVVPRVTYKGTSESFVSHPDPETIIKVTLEF